MEEMKTNIDVEELLNELENEEVPAMSPEFEAQAMDRIVRRRKELEAEEAPAPATRKGGRALRIWLAAAAVFVFLIGGTLLTRDRLRAQPLNPAGIGLPSGSPSAYHPDGPETDGQENGPGAAAVFMEDMGLFVKAALPYLGGAAAIGAVCLVIVKKRRKPKE